MARGVKTGSNELIIVLMPIVAGATGAAARVSSLEISAVAWTGQEKKPNVGAGVKIVYMTYGCFDHMVLLTKGDIFSGRKLHIIADEVHVQTNEVSFALTALAFIQKNRTVYPTILSITVMSATLDRDAIAAMFDGGVSFEEVEYRKPFPNGPLKVVEVKTESPNKFLEFAVEQVVRQLRALSDSGSLQGGQTILVVAPGVTTANDIIDKCRDPKFVFWNRFQYKSPLTLNSDQTLIMIWSSEGISTSVTIPNLGFLIIIGMCKSMSSTGNPLITQMGVRPMTKAEEVQTLGRADRIEPIKKLHITWHHPQIPKKEHCSPAVLSQFETDLIEKTLDPASEKSDGYFWNKYGYSYTNCMKIQMSFVPHEIFLKLSKLKTVSENDKRKFILLMELMLRFFGKSTSIIGQIVHVDMVEVMGRHSRVQLSQRDENGLIQFCLNAVIQKKTYELTPLPPKFTFAEGGEREFSKLVSLFMYNVTPSLSVFGHFDRDKIELFDICELFEMNTRLVPIVAFTKPYVRVKNVDDQDTSHKFDDEDPCENPIICPVGIIFPAKKCSILSTVEICFTLPETPLQESDDEESPTISAASPTRSGFGGRGGGSAASPARSGFGGGRGSGGTASPAPFGFGGRGGDAASPATFGFGRGRGGSAAASPARSGFAERGGDAASPALPGFGGRGGSTAAALPGFGGRGGGSAATEPKLLPPGQGRGAPHHFSRGGKF
jgi:hypothetical protein